MPGDVVHPAKWGYVFLFLRGEGASPFFIFDGDIKIKEQGWSAVGQYRELRKGYGEKNSCSNRNLVLLSSEYSQ